MSSYDYFTGIHECICIWIMNLYIWIMNSYMNFYKLWIHVIISYMTSYGSWINSCMNLGVPRFQMARIKWSYAAPTRSVQALQMACHWPQLPIPLPLQGPGGWISIYPWRLPNRWHGNRINWSCIPGPILPADRAASVCSVLGGPAAGHWQRPGLTDSHRRDRQWQFES